jgi:hypothetical protein
MKINESDQRTFASFTGFCAIQRKIPQKSDIPKTQDSNPVPHGEIEVDIAKMFP